MKTKLTLALVVVMAALLCCTAFAADLVPMITIAPEDFANYSYSASLTFSEDGTEATVNVYQQDYFDAEEVQALQEGDTITIGGFDDEGNDVAVKVVVKTVEEDADGWYLINGGWENWEENGITLIPDAGEYTTLEEDDYHTKTLQGTATFPLADTVKLQHFIMDDEQGLLDEYSDEDFAAADVKAAIEAAGLESYPMSVTVTDGKIEIIMIHYCP